MTMARNGKVKPAELAVRAREQLAELLGREPEAVLGIQRNDDDGWKVKLEVLELHRVPETMDLLGCYVVELDEDGDLVGYERRRRYARGASDEDDE
jgi:hypothetical protein